MFHHVSFSAACSHLQKLPPSISISDKWSWFWWSPNLIFKVFHQRILVGIVAIGKVRPACEQSLALCQQATTGFMRPNHSIIACSRHVYIYCCSSHTSRSWWITSSTQRQRRSCNSIFRNVFFATMQSVEFFPPLATLFALGFVASVSRFFRHKWLRNFSVESRGLGLRLAAWCDVRCTWNFNRKIFNFCYSDIIR